MAGALAAALGARKAIFLTDVEGLYADVTDRTSLVSECDLATLEEMMASGAVGAGMIPKLRAVGDALRGGVEAAHIVDGRVPHSVLMELLTEAGIGTKITA